MTAQISVVVPCYNQAPYLRECIESLAQQTRRDFEVVIVNDGSTDHSEALARELQAEFGELAIRIVVQINRGLSEARNSGVRAATGRYILPLDADDKIHPTMLEKCARLLDEREDIGIAYTDYRHFQDVDHTVHTPEYDRHALMNQKCLHTASAMYRRSAWEATGGYRSNMVWGTEDWEFWVSCAEKGFVGQRIPEVLFFYRAKLNKSMISVAKAHFPYLWGRVVLNHPASYSEPIRQWARARWVEGLQLLIDDTSHLRRYSLNQTLVELVEDSELLVAAGEVDLAVRYHRRWLDFHSGAGAFGAHFNLGVYLLQLGRRADARTQFEQARAYRADYTPLTTVLAELQV